MIIRCLLMLWITVLVTGCTLKDEEQLSPRRGIPEKLYLSKSGRNILLLPLP